jgi:predicted small lipoprotein YifL
MIRAAAILSALFLAAACGQKGPLKLPAPPAPGVPTPAPAAPPSSP